MAPLTKAQQVAMSLRDSILRGDRVPGELLPPERQLLSELGVSRGTLRQALSTLAHDGLVVCRQGSGTYVAERARVGTVALFGKSRLVSSPSGYWYQRLFDEASQRIDDSGYRSVMAIGRGDTSDDVASSVHLFDDHVLRDTLGVFSSTVLGDLADRLRDLGIPAVTISAGLPVDSHCVTLDYRRMFALASDILRERGYSDFALMHWQHTDDATSNWFQKFDAEMIHIQESTVDFQAGRLVPVPMDINADRLSYAPAYEAFKDWWARPEGRPRAIFIDDEVLCSVASQVILELGIRIPEELAVITHLNVGRPLHFPVPLTSIGFDAVEAVSVAWEMLKKLIEGEPVANPVVFVEPRVCIGRSL
jgi:DNA-binding LacI/PurR family transcriptional regulator